ncbi:DUF1244 domain-containing protein [Vibrio fortis]
MAEFKYKNLSQEEQDKLDAATFRRLLAHLDYGMTYDEWKQNHQPKATPEQLAAFEAKQKPE